jgi:hypothetical protein
MQTMKCLAYISNAVELPVSEEALERLLQGARRFNEQMGVTGALMHDDGSFLQYLEGEPEALGRVMHRVYADPMHRNVTVLMTGTLHERGFPDWRMACTRVQTSHMLELANAQWAAHLADPPRTSVPSANHDGMVLLRRFWEHRRAARTAVADASLGQTQAQRRSA